MRLRFAPAAKILLLVLCLGWLPVQRNGCGRRR